MIWGVVKGDVRKSFNLFAQCFFGLDNTFIFFGTKGDSDVTDGGFK